MMTKVETEASTEADPQPCAKVSYQNTANQSTKIDEEFNQYLALFCILLYLLAASHKHDDIPRRHTKYVLTKMEVLTVFAPVRVFKSAPDESRRTL